MENSTLELEPVIFAQNQDGEILLSLGHDENGEVFIQNLSSIPHFLVCGFSGSGKSSFVQSLMTQLCRTQSTDNICFIVYDSKGIDYSVFNGTPYMLCPVITEEQKAAEAVRWLNTEVQRRIKIFLDTGTKDYAEYNRKSANMLPRIFVIFDDFSSAHLNEQMSTVLTNILKNGRVAGVHVMVVTSLPSSKVLKKDIISNLPCRISFCVSSRADSRVAIEQTGAENLQVPGEMIFKYHNIFARCQATYVPFSDIQETMKSLYKQQSKDFVTNVLSKERSLQCFDELDDELLTAAVEVILETNQVSVSMLQRRLKLGYARAARIMDVMEEKGIVGPFEGLKARSILVTREQWDAMQGGSTPSNVLQKKAAPKPAVAEIAPIVLRDFEEFRVIDATISVYENKVRVSKKIITHYGSGITDVQFTGDSFSALVYKKPRLFSHGYIEFKFKEKVAVTNNQPDLVDVNQNNMEEFARVEFGGAQAKIVHLFLLQLAEDTHVQIKEI